MKRIRFAGVVMNKEQLTNSKEGGPRVRVTLTEVCFSAHDGVRFTNIVATTATNSSAGYCLTCLME